MSETQTDQSPFSEPTVSWALQSSPANGGLLVDSHQIRAIAGGAAQMLRLPEGDDLQLPLEHLPSPLLEMIRQVLSNPGQGLKRQVIHWELDGKPTMLVEATTLGCGQGSDALLLLLKDASFSTEMRRRLTHLDRLLTLGTLSANVAHELRNAFVAVKTFIDLLLEKNQDAELVGLVQHELGRIDELLQQALRMAEPATSSARLVSVNRVVMKTLQLIEPRLRKTGIVLCQDLAPGPDHVEGVENELQQALINLVMNAVEAMGSQGTLTVSTARDAGSNPGGHPRVILTIKDTGPGVPAENRGRLFEPFFTTKPGGTGLGLAITQRIVSEHRGVIELQTGPEGTEFRLIFPAHV